MARSLLVNFRISNEERTLLREVAERRQTTYSAFLREAIYKAAGVGVKSLADTRRPQQRAEK